uniref:Putative ovule protein n=1 Tax=Solanum chacoense TaxID=4108 RepID=A0A0V0GWH8_SOLCH
MFVSMIPYHNSVRINSLIGGKNALATRFKYCKLTVVVTCYCWMLEVSISLFVYIFFLVSLSFSFWRIITRKY